MLKKVWRLRRENLLKDVKHSLTKQKNIKIIGEVIEKNKSNEENFDIEETAGQIFKGKYFPPGDKSISHRILILTGQSIGKSTIISPSTPEFLASFINFVFP